MTLNEVRIRIAQFMNGAACDPPQLALDFRTERARSNWGGKRKNAGRPRGRRGKVLHRERPAHNFRHPVLVTMRGAAHLPPFRSQLLTRVFREAIGNTRREDFRIAEYSIQNDHVHLIVEADDKAALSRGIKSFAVRAIRRVNRELRRRTGRVWGDRYHRRDLTSPLEVRRALVYVLSNWRKHFGVMDGRPFIDPHSSAQWFSGWIHPRSQSPPPGEPPTARALTWLLRKGWHEQHGFIHPGEAPRPRPPGPTRQSNRIG